MEKRAEMGEAVVGLKSGHEAAQTATAPEQDPIAKDDQEMPTSKSIKSPAFQFYPKDFLSSSKVDDMSMTERGVYITLLSRCWLDNGLPADMRLLAKFARMKPAQFERVWTHGQLHNCFYERAGRFHNERLDVERKKQSEHSKKQKDRADLRWHPKASGDAVALQAPHPPGNALQSSSASASAKERERTRPQSIVQKRRGYAAFECGGIYVPQQTHVDLLGLHPAGFEPKLFEWYQSVADAWQGRNTGADMIRFWKARHDETWAPERPKVALPATGPRTVSAKEHPYAKHYHRTGTEGA